MFIELVDALETFRDIKHIPGGGESSHKLLENLNVMKHCQFA